MPGCVPAVAQLVWGTTVRGMRAGRAAALGLSVVAVSTAAFAVAQAMGTPEGNGSSAAASPTALPSVPQGTPTTSAAGSSARTSARATPTPAFRSAPEPTFVATDPPPSPVGSTVPVTITNASWNAPTRSVRVHGFVGGIDEDGGTCTLTLTRGSHRQTASAPGGVDATTTSCGLLQVGGDLASGTWTAVLSYRSPTATGTSAPVTVDVP